MCGITGYIGDRNAREVLLDCLEKLEYRGYDSCGIAVMDNEIRIAKDAARVAVLKETAPLLQGKIGIGHTRWATHGECSARNAHPHTDCRGRVAVVHNGTIDNYQQLRTRLEAAGHVFKSETDTEVLPHLIEGYYQDSFPAAVERALQDVEGSYAIIVLMAGESCLVAARKGSPLVIGLGDHETFIASDVTALLDYTSRVIYLEDEDIAVITADSVEIMHHGVPVIRDEHRITWTVEDARRGGYDHFFIKEVHETPKVIRDTLGGYLSAAETDGTGQLRLSGRELLILASGSSYHAGLLGQYLVEMLAGIPVRIRYAAEFAQHGYIEPGTIVIALTQSGETLDVLKAVQRVRERGGYIVGISNVIGSSITRLADRMLYTRAGPEISVAASKTFVAQLIAMYWLASRAMPGEQTVDDFNSTLRQLPGRVEQALDDITQIHDAARMLASYENAFFIGRGLNYPIALEGALKLKELSYIHAEGYAAGELKHGSFALLNERLPVIAIMTGGITYQPMITSLKEIKARHAPVIVLASEDDVIAETLADAVIQIPRIEPLLAPVVNAVTLQLLAYYTACERGCPIDYPRNLAKSVTVD